MNMKQSTFPVMLKKAETNMFFLYLIQNIYKCVKSLQDIKILSVSFVALQRVRKNGLLKTKVRKSLFF